MKFRVLLFALVAVIAMLWLEHRPGQTRSVKGPISAELAPPVPVAPAEPAVQPRPVNPAAPSAANRPAPPAPDASETPVTTVNEIAPATETLRQEVAQNPHQAPVSLVRFAAELGDRMVVAETSEEEAAKFFPELKDCVLNAQQARTTRALCLANADRLGKKFTSLHGDFESLRSEADPEIVNLANE